MISLFEIQQKLRTCEECGSNTTNENGICKTCFDEIFCRFCGFEVDEHTEIINGVKICPDQESV